MICGKNEKYDCRVEIEKSLKTEIIINSKYNDLFYESIKKTAELFDSDNGISGYRITINDCGALEYTIKARLESCFRKSGVKIND